jgi:hypothetical protein
MFFFVGTTVAAVGGALGALFRMRRDNEPVDMCLYFLCQCCKRKLRYRASQSGKPGACPSCRQRWILP